MREHRVPLLSAPLRRYPDPELSADPRIYTLLTDLRILDVAPVPRAHFRAELRAQLVAVAPRLIAEGTAAERPLNEAHAEAEASTAGRRGARADAPARDLPRSPASRFAGLRTVSLGRPVAIVTAVVAVFALLLGTSVWFSKHALPGDALYSLKRANETVQLSLADGATAKSKAYLNFAGERADEVAALLKRASAVAAGSGASAGRLSPHTASLVDSTLSAGDSDVRSASRLLGQNAVNDHSAGSLSILTGWAPGQLAKLQAIQAKLPAGALQSHAAMSAQLVSNAFVRAQQLSGLIDCSCLSSTTTDELGPVPCTPCMSPAVPLPTLPSTVPLPAGTTTGGSATGSGSSGPVAGTGSGAGGVQAGTGSDTGGTPDNSAPSTKKPPGITLPTLPPITFPTKTGTKTSTPTCVVSLLGFCLKVGN